MDDSIDTKILEMMEKETDETEEDLFGRMVSKTLKRLAPTQSRFARQKIDAVLFDAEFTGEVSSTMFNGGVTSTFQGL
jgi:hypothetical protein